MGIFQKYTPQEFYNTYSSSRQSYEDRAKEISSYTLPYLFEEDSFTGSSSMRDKISQSFCGRLINTLKAKMGMSLLPPSTSSFRLEPDKESLMVLSEGNPDFIAEVMAKMSSVTSQVTKEIEAQQVRDTIFDMLLQLIAVGSVIMEKIKDDGIMLHTLQNFAVELDSRGEAIAMCILEKKKSVPEGYSGEEKDEYKLYTLVEKNFETNRWHLRQSVEGEDVGKEIIYTYDKLPFQYVGWNWTTGDTYHRPYAEDYLEDMKQYNSLSSLLTQGSIIASKSVLMVDQRGNRTRIQDLVNAKNGDVINGNAADVTAFQLQKNFDFQIPMERLQDIQKNLSSAFLMNESVTRDAERVTAQEIRFMAQELETSSLSGVYSKLSKKVSKRIVQWIMQELKLEFKEVSINVVTGLDALGRSQEAQKLDSLVQRLASMNLMHYLNEAELIQRYASFEGIDVTGLVKSPTQVQQEMKQAQEQAMLQQGGEALMQSAGQSAGQSIAQ